MASVPDTFLFKKRLFHHLNALCRPEMEGRGYNGDGHLRAGRYLAGEWKKAGVLPLNGSDYFQYFDFSVNLITDASLKIQGKPLQIGVDFMPHESSPAGSVSGETFLADFGTDFKEANVKGKIVIIKEGQPENIKTVLKLSDEDNITAAHRAGAAAVLLMRKKLTHGFSDRPAPLPVMYVLITAVPDWGKSSSVKLSVKGSVKTIQTQNVAGIVKGTRVPDSAFVICAHYDHLGKVGKAVFTGANDNASGTAFLTAAAEHYAKHPSEYSIIFLAFSAEEAGLHGSFHFVNRPLFPLERIKMVLNFDLLGNGQAGAMTVGGSTYKPEFELLTRLNEGSAMPIRPLSSRPNAPNSDHYPFTQKGVPAFFFYTMGGSSAYHDVEDVPKNISFYLASRLFLLTDAFIKENVKQKTDR